MIYDSLFATEYTVSPTSSVKREANPQASLTDVTAIPGLRELWRQTLGDPKLCIAVLDGPINLSHPSLLHADVTQIELPAMCRLAAPAAFDHGTSVASIIFGQHDGPLKGIAPRCHGLSIPVFGCDAGSGQLQPTAQTQLAQAIRTAVRYGANVINISGGQLIGNGDGDDELRSVLEEVADRVLVIAAAGNDGAAVHHFPGASPSVVAVGAMRADGEPAAFSNWGDAYRGNGLLAPGENLLAANGGDGWMIVSGTSFSTAIVSGVAGLLLSEQSHTSGRLDPARVRRVLFESAVNCEVQPTDNCDRLLVGRLNVEGAHRNLRKGTEDVNHQIQSLAGNGTQFREGIGQELQPACATAPSASSTSNEPASKAAPTGCGCQGNKTFPLVYPIGRLDFVFPSVVRRDSIEQHMDTIEATGYKLNPNNPLDLLRHLMGFTEYQVTYFDGNIESVTKDDNKFLITVDTDIIDSNDDTYRAIELKGILKKVGDAAPVLAERLNSVHRMVPVYDEHGNIKKREFHLANLPYRPQHATFDATDAKFIFPKRCTPTQKHAPHRYDAEAIRWVLERDTAPIYAIMPRGPFAEDAYQELMGFLLSQLGLTKVALDYFYHFKDGKKYELWDTWTDHNAWDPRFNEKFCDGDEPTYWVVTQNYVPQPTRLRLPHATDYVAMPGTIIGTERLITSETVEVIDPDMRGTCEWSLDELINAILIQAAKLDASGTVCVPSPDDLRKIVEALAARFAEEIRNSGKSPQERAMNFAALQLMLFLEANAAKSLWETPELESIFPPKPSAVCREGSVCFDVEIAFFDPESVKKASTIVSQTVDVSDVVPVALGNTRSFRRRSGTV